MRPTSIARKIRAGLSTIPDGEIFTYRFFLEGEKEEELMAAIIKELSRQAKTGNIVRLEKGKFYKPRQTRFGTLRPEEGQFIKTLTTKNNRTVGYLTGIALYNQLGLTTQVPNVLTIARNSRLPGKEINGYKVKFVTKPNKFRTKDIPLLQLLDALQDIKEIPDTSPDKAIPIIVGYLQKLTQDEMIRMSKLALDYNPATRALLGAIVEQNFSSVPIASLKKSLNPLSKYKLGITDKVLPNKLNWFIE